MIKGNKEVLLDLFYQCTDNKSEDVEWIECRESFKTFDLDFAILRVKLKCGKVIEVSNQFGNIHVVEM
jgi:hypothetical protein